MSIKSISSINNINYSIVPTSQAGQYYNTPFAFQAPIINTTGSNKDLLLLGGMLTALLSLALLILPSKKKSNIQKLFIAGNAGNSCHTMALLNSLRVYYSLENKQPPISLNKDWAFEVLRDKHSIFKSHLLNDGSTTEDKESLTLLIPKILCDKLNIKLSEYPMFTDKLSESLPKILTDLSNNKTGIILLPIRGNHYISVYGVIKNNTYRQAKQGKMAGLNLQELKFKIYDQNTDQHETLSLAEMTKGKLAPVFSIINSEFTGSSYVEEKAFSKLNIQF